MNTVRLLTAASLGGTLLAAPILVGAGPAQAQASAAPTAATTHCSAYKAPGRVKTVKGQPAATTRKARAILAGTVKCDKSALSALSRRDRTRLGFGLESARTFFAVPDSDGRYADIAAALTKARPGYEKESRSYVWPRVATTEGDKDPAAWNEAIRAGLITAKEARELHKEGSGYMGWRLTVDRKGNWQSVVAGD